ncbi:TPA: hypothetical protein QIB60_004399 [Enterobacter cloacae subsp. dissolvens]|nr:hypothetical protein [Enterobacter cloacae subsp. dissolvens]
MNHSQVGSSPCSKEPHDASRINFKNGNNRAIRLPRDLDFEGVSELEIKVSDNLSAVVAITSIKIDMLKKSKA